MKPRGQVYHLDQLARFEADHLVNVPLFNEQDFSACLLTLMPGQVLPVHTHEHEDEVFDVVAGHGRIWLDGQAVPAGPATSVFVPAGVPHGFENGGQGAWVIRATIHERVYARQALARAALKRLGRQAR